MFEGKEKEISALVLLVVLFPLGSGLILHGNALYNETSVQLNAFRSSHPITFATNVPYINLTEVNWEIATPHQDPADGEWSQVTLRLGTIQVNYTIGIQFPYEARNVRGLDYDLVNCSYVPSEDYYNLTIIPKDHIVVVYFSWRVFTRWSYDTYSIEMPLYPFFYGCGAGTFNITILSPEHSILDLSRTFPYPSSATGEASPTYIWGTSNPQEIHDRFAGRLRAFFVFPEKAGALRYVTFQAGIFIAFGVSMIIGGLTNTIIYIVNAISTDSWTREKLRILKTLVRHERVYGKRKLNENERREIGQRIEAMFLTNWNSKIRIDLARKFKCSPSQISAIKGHVHKRCQRNEAE